MTKDTERRIDFSNRHFAEIVIGDTILAAHTNPEFTGDNFLKEILDTLKGKEWQGPVQFALAQYAGSVLAAAHTQTVSRFDERVLGDTTNINAAGVRDEMVAQLQDYLQQPKFEREKVVADLKAQEEARRIQKLEDTLEKLVATWQNEPKYEGDETQKYLSWEDEVGRITDTAIELGASSLDLAFCHFKGVEEETRQSLFYVYADEPDDMSSEDIEAIRVKFGLEPVES